MGEATVRWTGAAVEDLDAWVTALAVIEAFDRTGETIGRADLEDELGLSYVDPAADVRLGWSGDAVVAWGTVVCIPSVHQRRVQLAGAVVPSRRGTGIGAELLEWLVARGAHVAAAQPHDAPGWLELGATQGDTAREQLFAKFGFAPLRYYFEMRRPLAGLAEAPRAVPAPLRLAPFELAHDDTARHAHNEAFRDHFAANELDAETWQTWVTGGHGFRPDCSFLVWDGDEIAGYALNSVHPDDWPGLGFTEGWTHQLGVRRRWRGRGVATALLDATAAVFAAKGLQYATLDVDAENPTGALGLYESQGYRREKTRVAWSLPVVSNRNAPG
ncbi:MAG: GNAT family N-acetyltransferase [Acidimicrobiia bacterium]